jgi:protein TonB
METQINYMGWAMDDIIFHHRNKDYGAYQLRKLTEKNVRVGMIVAFTSFTLFIAAAQLDWRFLNPVKPEPIGPIANPTDLPVIDHAVIPPPPPPTPPPVRPTIAFVEMVIRKQEEVQEDEPTKNDEIQNNDISDKTQAGDTMAPPIMDEVTGTPEPPERKEPYVFVEQKPEFPGGDAALLKFMRDNIKYPEMELSNDIQGRVLLRFVVLEDGSVSNVEVQRGVSPGLDREAQRVAKLLPKFTPGKQQGRAVKVYFNLPVKFSTN